MVNAPTRENERFHSANSKYSGGETQNWSNPSDGKRLVMNISRSGSGYPSGRRITPLTTEKMAVFAPMPSASVRIVTRANPGVRRRFRTACLRSWIRVDMVQKYTGQNSAAFASRRLTCARDVTIV